MSVTSPPDTDSRIVAGLGMFCGAFLRRGDVEPVVIRGYVNRVSKPKVPDYVLVTPMTMTRLATNNHQWDAETGVQSVTPPTRRRVQIDCYGNNAAVWAKTLATLLRDAVGCDFLAPYGLAPLFVEDPQELTQAEGDEQYHPRFMLGVMLQVNETVSVGLDYFTDVNLYLRPLA